MSSKTDINYLVVREDESFYDTSDLDVVLADDNSIGKVIKKLKIRLVVEKEISKKPVGGSRKGLMLVREEKQEIVVIFFNSAKVDDEFKSEPSIGIAITEENRDWCFLLADELDAQIKRSLKGYFKYLRTGAIDPVLAGLLVIASIIWVPYLVPSSTLTAKEIESLSTDDRVKHILELLTQQQNFTGQFFMYALVLIVIVFFIIIFNPIARLSKLLGRSVFYWGDMIGVYDGYKKRMAQYKWGIGIALIISIIAGIFVSQLDKIW